MRDVYLFVLSLDPRQLIYYFIPPFVHAFISNIHLRVEDPQEAKSFFGEGLHLDIHDLGIRHSAVVEVELIVREHKACVISLSPLDSPWWIYMDYLEVTKFFNQILQIEESEITIDKSVRPKIDLMHLINGVDRFFPRNLVVIIIVTF